MDVNKIYKSKLMSADDAAMLIEDGDCIATDLFLAEPKSMYEALNKRIMADNIHGCKMITALDLYPLLSYKDPQYKKNIQAISAFCSPLTRKAVNSPLADYCPYTYWDQPAVSRLQGYWNVFMISVSPMNDEGYFSLGVTGSGSNAYIEQAKKIIVEVNNKMPFNLHGEKIHVNDVAAIVENSYDLPVAPNGPLDEISKTIGGYISEQIKDGACLQLGIGGIPDAVGLALKDKKHLGIHTEMLTDSMIELIECGAVDNSMKQVMPGITLATFGFGSQRIYDYINNNPKCAIMPVDYVNNPYVIAQNDNMISVNAALEVDLFGQVCAESIGPSIFSGSGGQLDYVRGAVMSKGGSSYIAFPSSAKEGTISKIVPTLTPGSMVTTGKNEVDMIVTEYGIAKLRGKTFAERAKALISIAAPQFRDELTAAAKKLNLFI